MISIATLFSKVYTVSVCRFFSDAFSSMGKSVMQDLLNAFPGIDEAMSYSEVMKYVMQQI